MIKPLEILTSEHRVIEQVLNCLEKLTEQCHAAGKLDKESARQALEFFRTFADHCHHAKEEDHLFPALQAHGLGGGCGPVAVMMREHELGRLYLEGMDAVLETAAAGDPHAVQWFIQHAHSYIRLMRAHIRKEDHCLFAHAESVLGPEDERKVLASFEKVEAEKLGPGSHEKALALANQLADRYGVAKVASAECHAGNCP